MIESDQLPPPPRPRRNAKIEKNLVAYLGHQLAVGERVGVHDAGQGVAEDVGVIAVIVAPLQFFQIAVHVLGAHLVEAADDGALEEAPDTFDAVGVYVSDCPFLGAVANRFVARVVVTDPDVALEVVGVDRFGFVSDGALDKVMQGVLADVGDALDADAAARARWPRPPNACWRASRRPFVCRRSSSRLLR